MKLTEPARKISAQHPWDTSSDTAYRAWRGQKLEQLALENDPVGRVEIRDLANPTQAECTELIRRCMVTNAVFYASHRPGNADHIRTSLRNFSASLGLTIAERHRSADSDGIVALRQVSHGEQRGYIPYSRKGMNWHTDGYYNSPEQNIRAMVMHCVHPAAVGGVNQFLDPEIAYIRLRDENPGYIDALMHPRAMTIPQNSNKDGVVRPVSIGPVYSVDAESGHLAMRYTARSRSIVWRDDLMTAQAVAFLNTVLQSDEANIQTTKLQAGEGVLCNNSLHNRTAFDPDTQADSERLVFRIRFHNRVSGGQNWQN